MTTVNKSTRFSTRLGPRPQEEGTQVVVARDLPVLFQIPAVNGAKGNVASPTAEKIKAHGELPQETPAASKPVPKTAASPQPEASTSPKSNPSVSRARPAEKSGWFDGQGKLITVCFLIALTATIYFARSRGKDSVKRNEAWPMAHPGDAQDLANKDGMQPPAISVPAPNEQLAASAAPQPLPPAAAVPPAVPVAPAVPPVPPAAVVTNTPPALPKPQPETPPVAPTPEATSVASAPPEVKLLTPKEAPASRSQLPPTSEIAASPVTNNREESPPIAPGSEPLPETRVATAPAPARSGWQPPAAENTISADPPVDYGSYPPPAREGYPLNPSPPSTATSNLNQNYAPSRYMPSAQPAPAAPSKSMYPTTDPARFRYYNPTGSNVAPGTALPGNQPRNERTGSSLY